jgi:hypothetical protein
MNNHEFTLLIALFILMGWIASSVSSKYHSEFAEDLQTAIDSGYDILYEGIHIDSIPTSVIENKHLYGWNFNKEDGVLKITNLRHS